MLEPVAAFTHPSAAELAAFLQSHGIEKPAGFHAVEGGSVNSNFRVDVPSKSFFLRIYEEQDVAGAMTELEMLKVLVAGGVATPLPLGGIGELAKQPAALFEWVPGEMACQSSVTPARAGVLGAALANVHRAGKDVKAGRGRFHVDALASRLDDVDAEVFPVERLRRELAEIANARDTSIPTGLVHGDLFRDNVLWEDDRLAALLDFESACAGPFVYDLAVTLLAWCFASEFDAPCARALVAGYERIRPLSRDEKHAFYTEARLAALRFTITRITDYAMPRPGDRPDVKRVIKDWRRFLARLDALATMGDADFLKLVAAAQA